MQVIIARVGFICPACGGILTEKKRWYGNEWVCTKCRRIWGTETYLPTFIDFETIFSEVIKEASKVIPYDELKR